MEQLCVVASAVKQARDAHRQTTLITELRGVADKFVGTFRLPLDPALLVRGVDVDACSFFSSNTVPLRLAFLNADPCGDNIDILFKVRHSNPDLCYLHVMILGFYGLLTFEL